MMEMWLKRSTLVFLTVIVAAAGTSGQVPVILNKTQLTVYIPLGSSLTFHCRLRIEKYVTFRVLWYFNPFESSFNDSHKLTQELHNKSARTSTNETERDGQTLSKYTLSDATERNSGWYFCRVIVEIPILNISESSGTHVVITKRVEHTTHPSLPVVTDKQATVSPADNLSLLDWWLWITLGVSAVILIVLLVICVLMRKRGRSSREDPVYANTRPVASKQPSPRPDMPVENLKMVPSSQTVRNPSPGRRYEGGKGRYKE
ncbi:uncharacterized protein LOC121605809 isoform X2 [Chelmon rostratus]|uniref:uncharacterized protein LOC121605809 isoform X2 n=1 Tax=Chelmon rostratus TaxID=109905 RepID=UPI001BE8B90B|nr:uncharacterized protein LOC121605809 isoform X2 [Chelmon rostratus]